MIATILLSAAAATAAQAPELRVESQGAERVLRMVELRGLIGSRGSDDLPPFGSMLGGYSETPYLSLLDESLLESRQMSPDFLVESASMYLDRLDPDADETSVVELIGSRLVISGPREQLDLVLHALRAVEDEIVRPIEVVARLYDVAPAARFPTRFEPDSVPDLGEPIWIGKASTRSGQVAGLAQQLFTQFVRDADVEVAQEQSISDPIVRERFEGIVLRVEPHAVPGSDDLVVYCHAAIGEAREPVPSRSTGLSEMVALDVPVLENSAATFSGRIANGGALALHLGGDPRGGSSRLLVVEAERASSTTQRQVDDVFVFPHSALTTGSLTSAVSPASRFDEWEEESEAMSILPLNHEGEDDGEFRVEVDAVLELIHRIVEPAVDEERVEFTTHGGWLFVMGEREVCRTVESTLASLHQQWIRTVHVELVTEMAPAEGDRRAFARTSRAGDRVTLHRITAPLLVGRPHFMMRGLESTTTLDFDVEIAQDASAVDPVVTTTFGGAFSSLLVHDGFAGLGARAEVVVSTVDLGERRAAETRHGGDLYLPRTTRGRIVHRGGVDGGAVIDLGDVGVGTLDGRRWKLQQSMRVMSR